MKGAREVCVVAACRTPIGAFGKSLLPVRAPNLGAAVMKDVIKRAKIDPAIIQDVKMGCCLEDFEGLNIARVSALLAGIPDTVPAATINRVCCSAMDCVQSGVFQIQAGQMDCVLVGGVESMSNAYYYLPDSRFGQRLQDGKCCDSIIHALQVGSIHVPYPVNGPMKAMQGKKYIMGLTAEFLAQKHKFTREAQDKVALRSHNLAQRATEQGMFKDEICPIEIKGKKKKITIVDKDEHFRVNLTMDELTGLPPAFVPKVGTVTAGNSSGINDGASAMILMSKAKAESMGLKPLAVFTGMGIGGCAPEYMGESPLAAVKDLMRRTGRKVNEWDRVECNEAFAAQYLACEQGLGLNRDITNVNGSGIGLGHPVGSTGCRIIVTLLYELMHSQKNIGLATLCGGGGVALAVEISRC
jgi:acetyl-CoA C-acetyltransferase